MIETICGDKVALINEGSTFTDGGTLVSQGEVGYVVGHKGINDVVVHWSSGVGVAPRQLLAIINARPRQQTPRG